MVLIQCSVSDMPSTGYVSIFCRLSVFLNFSLLSLEIWVKKSNFAAHTNLLGLFWFIVGCVLLLFLLIGPHKIIPPDKSEERLQYYARGWREK